MRRPHHVSSREIERKFLVKRLPLGILRSRRFRIAQGYLANEQSGRHVRLRKKPSQASCRKFRPPRWFGREITGEKRYSNVRLANE